MPVPESRGRGTSWFSIWSPETAVAGGGYTVHVGFVLVCIGFAGAGYNQDTRFNVQPGDVVSVASPFGHVYDLTYEGLSMSIGRGERNLLASHSDSVREPRWHAQGNSYYGEEAIHEP